MWNVVILTVMISLAGFYSMQSEKILPNAQDAVARNLAESMATYRQAMINYASANPSASDKVKDKDLSSFYPTGYNSDFASKWTNYIDPVSGTIYVYPAAQLPVNITSELVKLSRNSILVGTANESGSLDAPADVANTNAAYIPPTSKLLLPTTASGAIPQSYPVWLAYRN